jgi:hypothetical protein
MLQSMIANMPDKTAKPARTGRSLDEWLVLASPHSAGRRPPARSIQW